MNYWGYCDNKKDGWKEEGEDKESKVALPAGPCRLSPNNRPAHMSRLYMKPEGTCEQDMRS